MGRTTFSHTFGTFFIALKRNIEAPVFVTKQADQYLAEFRTNKALHCLRLYSLADYRLFFMRVKRMGKTVFKVGF